MKCKNCGLEVNNTAEKCPQCGEFLNGKKSNDFLVGVGSAASLAGSATLLSKISKKDKIISNNLNLEDIDSPEMLASIDNVINNNENDEELFNEIIEENELNVNENNIDNTVESKSNNNLNKDYNDSLNISSNNEKKGNTKSKDQNTTNDTDINNEIKEEIAKDDSQSESESNEDTNSENNNSDKNKTKYSDDDSNKDINDNSTALTESNTPSDDTTTNSKSDVCICTHLCAENNYNQDCPVCRANYLLCDSINTNNSGKGDGGDAGGGGDSFNVDFADLENAIALLGGDSKAGTGAAISSITECEGYDGLLNNLNSVFTDPPAGKTQAINHVDFSSYTSSGGIINGFFGENGYFNSTKEKLINLRDRLIASVGIDQYKEAVLYSSLHDENGEIDPAKAVELWNMTHDGDDKDYSLMSQDEIDAFMATFNSDETIQSYFSSVGQDIADDLDEIGGIIDSSNYMDTAYYQFCLGKGKKLTEEDVIAYYEQFGNSVALSLVELGSYGILDLQSDTDTELIDYIGRETISGLYGPYDQTGSDGKSPDQNSGSTVNEDGDEEPGRNPDYPGKSDQQKQLEVYYWNILNADNANETTSNYAIMDGYIDDLIAGLPNPGGLATNDISVDSQLYKLLQAGAIDAAYATVENSDAPGGIETVRRAPFLEGILSEDEFNARKHNGSFTDTDGTPYDSYADYYVAKSNESIGVARSAAEEKNYQRYIAAITGGYNEDGTVQDGHRDNAWRMSRSLDEENFFLQHNYYEVALPNFESAQQAHTAAIQSPEFELPDGVVDADQDGNPDTVNGYTVEQEAELHAKADEAAAELERALATMSLYSSLVMEGKGLIDSRRQQFGEANGELSEEYFTEGMKLYESFMEDENSKIEDYLLSEYNFYGSEYYNAANGKNVSACSTALNEIAQFNILGIDPKYYKMPENPDEAAEIEASISMSQQDINNYLENSMNELNASLANNIMYYNSWLLASENVSLIFDGMIYNNHDALVENAREDADNWKNQNCGYWMTIDESMAGEAEYKRRYNEYDEDALNAAQDYAEALENYRIAESKFNEGYYNLLVKKGQEEDCEYTQEELDFMDNYVIKESLEVANIDKEIFIDYCKIHCSEFTDNESYEMVENLFSQIGLLQEDREYEIASLTSLTEMQKEGWDPKQDVVSSVKIQTYYDDDGYTSTTVLEVYDENGNKLDLTKEEIALHFARNYNSYKDIPFEYRSYIDKKIFNSFSQLTPTKLDVLYYDINKSKLSGIDPTKIINFNIEQGNLMIAKGQEAKFEAALDRRNDLGDWLTTTWWGLGDGFCQFGNGLVNFFGGADGVKSVSDYRAMLISSYLLNDYGSKFLNGTYEISTSIGNMIPTMAISMIPGCQAVGMALMGISCAGNTVEQCLQSGMTLGQAYTIGIISGTFEVVLQGILGGISKLQFKGFSFSKLLTSRISKFAAGSLERAICDYLLGMASEGLEEGLQEILGPGIENLAVYGLSAKDEFLEYKEQLRNGSYEDYLMGEYNEYKVNALATSSNLADREHLLNMSYEEWLDLASKGELNDILGNVLDVSMAHFEELKSDGYTLEMWKTDNLSHVDWNNVGKSALYGAITGGIMEGATTFIPEVVNYNLTGNTEIGLFTFLNAASAINSENMIKGKPISNLLMNLSTAGNILNYTLASDINLNEQFNTILKSSEFQEQFNSAKESSSNSETADSSNSENAIKKAFENIKEKLFDNSSDIQDDPEFRKAAANFLASEIANQYNLLRNGGFDASAVSRSAINSSIAEVNNVISAIDESIAELQAKLNDPLLDNKESINIQIESLEKYKATALEKLGNLTLELTENTNAINEHINSIKTLIDNINSNIATEESKLTKTKNKLEGLQKSLENDIKNNKLTKKQQAIREAEINNVQNQINSIESNIENMNSRITEINDVISMLSDSDFNMLDISTERFNLLLEYFNDTLIDTFAPEILTRFSEINSNNIVNIIENMSDGFFSKNYKLLKDSVSSIENETTKAKMSEKVTEKANTVKNKKLIDTYQLQEELKAKYGTELEKIEAKKAKQEANKAKLNDFIEKVKSKLTLNKDVKTTDTITSINNRIHTIDAEIGVLGTLGSIGIVGTTVGTSTLQDCSNILRNSINELMIKKETLLTLDENGISDIEIDSDSDTNLTNKEKIQTIDTMIEEKQQLYDKLTQLMGKYGDSSVINELREKLELEKYDLTQKLDALTTETTEVVKSDETIETLKTKVQNKLLEIQRQINNTTETISEDIKLKLEELKSKLQEARTSDEIEIIDADFEVIESEVSKVNLKSKVDNLLNQLKNTTETISKDIKLKLNDIKIKLQNAKTSTEIETLKSEFDSLKSQIQTKSIVKDLSQRFTSTFNQIYKNISNGASLFSETVASKFKGLMSELNTITSKEKISEIGKKFKQLFDSTINRSSNSIYEDFRRLGLSSDATFGADQGVIYSLCNFRYNGRSLTYREAKQLVNDAIKEGRPIPKISKIGSPEYFAIKNSIMTKYGLSENDASIILSSIDDAGACSYASVCNEIFASFLGCPEVFEQVFGYPMFRTINGHQTFNTPALLVDMYVNANMVENGGRLITKFGDHYVLLANAFSSKVDPLGRRLLNSGKYQQYMSTSNGKSVEIINKFLSQKGLKYQSKTLHEYGKINGNPSSIIEQVKQGIASGKVYSLGIYYGEHEIVMKSMNPRLYGDVSTFNWNEGEGHSIFVAGVNNEGFIVSSWGQEYLISYADVFKSGLSVLTEDVISYKTLSPDLQSVIDSASVPKSSPTPAVQARVTATNNTFSDSNVTITVKGGNDIIENASLKDLTQHNLISGEEELKIIKMIEDMYFSFYNQKSNIKSLNLDEDGKVIISKGMLNHRCSKDIENLRIISKYGVLASEWFGRLESGLEGRFCAFTSKMKGNDYNPIYWGSDSENDYSRLNVGENVILFFDESNEIMQKLLHLDYFEYEYIKSQGDININDIYSDDEIKILEFIESLSPDGKNMRKPYDDKLNYWSAIPGGIPPYLVNGICVKKVNYSEAELNELNSLFPSATIFNNERTVLRNPLTGNKSEVERTSTLKDNFESLSEVEVIDVNELSKNRIENKGILLGKKAYDMYEYYKNFDYVIKVNGSFESVIRIINDSSTNSNVLIEIDNLSELNSDLISQIPDNVKVRVGKIVDKYTIGKVADSFTADLKGWTYSASELEQIMSTVDEIFSGITEEMNDYEKAKYVYDYLVKNIRYEANPGPEIIRGRQYIGLDLLIEKEGTCLSFANTYKVLLNTLGIECEEVSGKLSGSHVQHAYNIVTIGEDTFIVDSTRESLNNYEGTGFRVENISEYKTRFEYNDLTSKINNIIKSTSVESIVEKMSETKSIEEIEYEKIKTRENKEEVKFKIGGEILTYSEVVEQIKERDIARLEEIARESGKDTLKDYSVSPSGKVSEETQLESNRLAVEVNNKAIEAEPRITEDLKSLESESTYLKGLEHKLKSQDSLSRKILSDSKTEGITLEEAAEKVSDSVRYTLIVEESEYKSKVIESLDYLRSKGYEVIKFKNKWGEEIYQGINVNLLSPDGVVFELQFHTEKSFETKEILNHLYYEVARSNFVTEEAKDLSNEIMKINQSKVEVPSEIISYDYLKSKSSEIAAAEKETM